MRIGVFKCLRIPANTPTKSNSSLNRFYGSITVNELEKLRDQLRAFAAERDWEQFHSPKNLAMAMSVEVAELLEHFQWLTEEQSRRMPADALAAVNEEAADILLYLIRISDKLGIDLIAAANKKIGTNARKYPADKARGTSKKYTEL
jgi:NTP pyrophosphatase (non-canonical NTP hydrolase)